MSNTARPARLFEMTRVMSLYGKRPSGVDRVCLAYLRALCAAPEPLFGLYRSSLGYLLLDKDGLTSLLRKLDAHEPWGEPDFLSRLRRKAPKSRQVTESDCRRLSIARCSRRGLRRMLRRHFSSGVSYINVDQANLPNRVLEAVDTLPNAQISVFLHDTIPLDHPGLQTRPTHVKFEQLMRRVRKHADLIFTNSQVSAEDIERHMSEWGSVPSIHVAHLGVEPLFFQNRDNPAPPDIPKPYFLMLGTLEPRKQHGMILDVWEAMANETLPVEMPHLVICGRRGWLSDELFARLDNSPLRGRLVHEFNDHDDPEIQHFLSHCKAVLFPSVAEGFGLPAVEAAAAGVPVVCSDLPVFREILEDIPIYVKVTDSYAWKEAIVELTKQGQAKGKNNLGKRAEYMPPTWESHFNTVLKMV